MAKIQDIRNRTPFTNNYRNVSSIKKIARHYSATTGGNFDSFWRHWNGVNGWGTGGYHEIILRDGTVQLCYAPNQITNGVGGRNSYIYNICLVGLNDFTAAQEVAWEERAKYWMQRLGLSAADVLGHNEFPGQSTACPGVNMNTVRARLRGQSSTATSDYFYLKQGDVGERIRLYQDKLKRAGYKIDVDGSFGPAMLKVVKQFQADNNLAVDGYLGPDTQKMINKILKVRGSEEELHLSKSEREEIAKIFAKAREKGVFQSRDKIKNKNADHEKNIIDGTMTLSRLQYLQTIIAGAGINGGKRIQ